MLELRESKRINNFHLLRLLAAIEVFTAHGLAHLEVPVPEWVVEILWWFPGVPIFFIASGFLITQSYCKNGSLTVFFRNRILRIFPALWVCLLVSLAVVALFGAAGDFWTEGAFWRWLAAQLMAFSSLAQVVASGMFNTFGTHELNGALWTLSVELQFYLILPLLLFVVFKAKLKFLCVFSISLASIGIYLITIDYWTKGPVSNIILFSYTSVFPHLFVFLIGVCAYIYFDFIKRWLINRILWWLSTYIVWRVLLWQAGYAGYWAVEKNVFLMLITKLLLAGAVLSFAFSLSGLSQRILGDNDISYGVYIYHMVVINIWVELGFTGSFWPLWAGLLVTCFVASLSWRFIEKPALSMKKPRLLLPQLA